MRKANFKLRELMEVGRVSHYEVAAALGVSRYTFSKWLSLELPEEKRKQIEAVIKRLAAANKAEMSSMF